VLRILYMENRLQLIQTEDGSHTLYVATIDETYHSTHGAVNESLHVFLHAGFDLCQQAEIQVLEVGFGTGLNAYLTALASESKQAVHYTSIEKYPLPKEIWQELNYVESYGNKKSLFEQIHNSPWEVETQLTPTFYLHKIQADFTFLSLHDKFDLIYFDAFSPDKQPDLWTEAIFEKLYQHTMGGGILTTYCAKGTVRRAMQAAGYRVERIPGPVGKREILRATKY